MDWKRRVLVIAGIQLALMQVKFNFIMMCYYLCYTHKNYGRKRRRYVMVDKIHKQVEHMNDLVNGTDEDCINNLRMDKNAFAKLCYLLRHSGGLQDERWVSVEEQTASFLHILAHHTKNRIIKFDFKRSGSTVSKYFNRTLGAVLKLHDTLLVKPHPVTTGCTNKNFKVFKGCLGALDGTFIEIQVPKADNAIYRTRKGKICTNVFGVCDMNMKFIYILAGWERSAADSRVLRDAITRPNGLQVPVGSIHNKKGTYYLCDNGYAKGEGFLTGYRGKRYHLEEWGPTRTRPLDFQEYFNMKHSKARNIIEKAFGHLKLRWAILRSPMFYPVKTQNKIIMACALIHNFIRTEMSVDPLDLIPEQPIPQEPDVEHIDTIQSSEEWTNWRDNFAQEMYNSWRNRTNGN